MNKTQILILLLSILPYYIFTQITVDESFDDWSTVPTTNDNGTDAPVGGIELESMQLFNDNDFLYINLKMESEINIQSDNELVMYIDYDNNADTGLGSGPFQGAEVVYEFGYRFGRFYNAAGSQFSISQADLQLVTLPTVTSERFEIAVRRNSYIGGSFRNMGGTVRVGFADQRNNGDQLPDSTQGVAYQMVAGFSSPPVPDLSKINASDIRIMSYNVLFDKMFESNDQPAFRRLFDAIVPDIIAFQEIYDHDAEEALQVVQQVLGGQWYSADSESDTKFVSRYPIVASQSIDGNMLAVIDINGQRIAIVNAHLPCCDNNVSRQNEIDRIGKAIRDSKAGFGATPLATNTPIIVLGDLNLVGNRENQQSLINGDIISTASYGDDYTPDWNGDSFTDLKPPTTGVAQTTTWYNPFSDFSAGRLDYFLYTASVMTVEKSFSLNLRNYSSAEAAAIGMFDNDAFDLSDHFPVVADVNFEVTSSIGLITAHPDISIYPNPVRDFLVVETDDPIHKIAVYNIMGQLVTEGTSHTVDVSGWPNGWYVILVEMADGTIWREEAVVVD